MTIRAVLCCGENANRQTIAKTLAERSIDRRIVQISTIRQIGLAHGRLRWIDMGASDEIKTAMAARGFERVSVEVAKLLLYPEGK